MIWYVCDGYDGSICGYGRMEVGSYDCACGLIVFLVAADC
jgi:hypothetical protein